MFLRDIFAERVRQLRTSNQLKQEDIAKLLGVTITQISDIERGRRTTSIENIVTLAEHFNVSLNWLVGLSSKKELE